MFVMYHIVTINSNIVTIFRQFSIHLFNVLWMFKIFNILVHSILELEISKHCNYSNPITHWTLLILHQTWDVPVIPVLILAVYPLSTKGHIDMVIPVLAGLNRAWYYPGIKSSQRHYCNPTLTISPFLWPSFSSLSSEIRDKKDGWGFKLSKYHRVRSTGFFSHKPSGDVSPTTSSTYRKIIEDLNQ